MHEDTPILSPRTDTTPSAAAVIVCRKTGIGPSIAKVMCEKLTGEQLAMIKSDSTPHEITQILNNKDNKSE